MTGIIALFGIPYLIEEYKTRKEGENIMYQIVSSGGNLDLYKFFKEDEIKKMVEFILHELHNLNTVDIYTDNKPGDFVVSEEPLTELMNETSLIHLMSKVADSIEVDNCDVKFIISGLQWSAQYHSIQDQWYLWELDIPRRILTQKDREYVEKMLEEYMFVE